MTPPEVFPIGVNDVPYVVAQYVVLAFPLYLFHVAEDGDVTRNGSFGITHERQDRILFAFDFFRFNGRIFLQCDFQKAFRQKNKLHLRVPR